MAITLYNSKTGEPKNFAHIIDAKESLANGAYTQKDPAAKPAVVEKVEVKPAKIPEVEDKKVVDKPQKPIKKEEEEVKPIKKISKFDKK